MKTYSVENAFSVRDPMDGGAVSVAVDGAVRVPVLRPLHGRRISASAPLLGSALTLLLLGGCGSGASTTQGLSVADGQPPATSSSSDSGSSDTGSVAGSEDESANDDTLAASSESADIILVTPAGKVDLPQQQVPSIQFKSLKSVSTARTGRTTTRNAIIADGGRSTVTSAASTQSGNVTISWDPPNQNEDGSSISDLAGYRVYQGNEENLSIVQELNETGAGERRLTQIPNVTTSNACFAVTAFDTSANESSLGDVVCKDVIVAAPPTNTLAPALVSVTQLAPSDGLADVQLIWQAPTASNAAAGSAVAQYSIYQGSQSQLFKIEELSEASTRSGGSHSHVVADIGGAQSCFALTARYTDGSETSLGEIVCVALVHSAPPQPGNELRPYNVAVDLINTNTARISWDKPNTVVSSSDATGIDRYDLYQGSRSQVYKLSEINETASAGTRRSTTVDNIFNGSNCFALTATDESRRQSALSTIVCADLSSESSTPTPTPPGSGTIGVTNVTAQETSPGSVALAWDAPELVAAGQPIANLSGYNLYQGSDTQLFKVAELGHSAGVVRQQIQRTEVDTANACFALTAFDSNGYEAPLSDVVCARISGTSSVPEYGIVPPTELATSALGGSTTVTLTWLASGAAATGAADPNVNRYNIYQGNHDRLFKVRQVKEEHDADPRTTTTFTGVSPTSACFAITAQYRDLRESRLSDIVCRDD